MRVCACLLERIATDESSGLTTADIVPIDTADAIDARMRLS
jgi:hypothetical protein